MQRHINKYYDPELTDQALKRGQHRTWVGGMWDEIGRLQFDFLKTQGLVPTHKVLDLGCGCFRAGVHLIEYLETSNYFGIDISAELLETGYREELVPKGLDARLPKSNLLSSGDFEACRFGIQFDTVIAQSVFTHLSLNHVRQCLARISSSVKIGGKFYLTAFLCPDDQPITEPFTHSPGGIVTSPVQDPFHYRAADFDYAAQGLPWQVEHYGSWNHPRNQSMVIFHRID